MVGLTRGRSLPQIVAAGALALAMAGGVAVTSGDDPDDSEAQNCSWSYCIYQDEADRNAFWYYGYNQPNGQYPTYYYW